MEDKHFKRVGQFYRLRYRNGILCGGIPHHGFGCFYSNDFKLFSTEKSESDDWKRELERTITLSLFEKA
ncbi:MAG: hypothetical protein QMD21_04920 [Candidatus Thermoplasmatota archaeon]|nr:hypothetical protein [Candidatus Thermoplasmatota archaeon]